MEPVIVPRQYDDLPMNNYNGLDLSSHRYANIFTVESSEDQEALRESINEVGQLDPITMFKGAILDGRHRYSACRRLGIEPRFTEFEGTEEEALAFVMAKNLTRRHLTTGQRALLALRLEGIYKEMAAARMKAGVTNPTPNLEQGTTAQLAANKVGVSASNVYNAKALTKAAEDATTFDARSWVEDQIKAVDENRMSLNAAVTAVKAKKEAESWDPSAVSLRRARGMLRVLRTLAIDVDKYGSDLISLSGDELNDWYACATTVLDV